MVKIFKTFLKDLLLLEVDCYDDERGYFLETWQKESYLKLGIREEFVQDNLSYSKYGVLRGLHYQKPYGQGKLVYVIEGEVYDVAVDIRKGSPTFGHWEGYFLSGTNSLQMYIPSGFAHGFCVTSEKAIFAYKCNNYYNNESEKGLIWNDATLGIKWPVKEPILSEKDLKLPRLKDLKTKDLPD